MTNTYLQIAIWIFMGLIVGGIIYFIFLKSPEAPTSPINNTSPTVPTYNEVNVTLISAPDCSECNSSSVLVSQLQASADNFNIRIGSVNTLSGNSSEAAALISKYSIEKLPSVILSSNAKNSERLVSVWTTNVGTVESDGSLVLRSVFPPYYDVESAVVVGLIEGVSIRASGCNECLDASAYLDSLEAIGMAFSVKKTLDENESEAQELISKYNITKLPVLILNQDATAYDFFNQQILLLGTVESDGWFVMRNISPPYVDLERNHSVRGVVEAILLLNSSCTKCFDPSALSAYISQSAGLFVVNTTSYDVNSSSGTELVGRYNITHIPTVLYSPEASAYSGFETVWMDQNNTVENDGWFVFRAHNLLSVPYQNVSE